MVAASLPFDSENNRRQQFKGDLRCPFLSDYHLQQGRRPLYNCLMNVHINLDQSPSKLEQLPLRPKDGLEPIHNSDYSSLTQWAINRVAVAHRSRFSYADISAMHLTMCAEEEGANRRKGGARTTRTKQSRTIQRKTRRKTLWRVLRAAKWVLQK